jgi:hypothetical protein
MTPTRVLRIIAGMNVGVPALQVSGLARHLDPARFEHRLLVGSVGSDEADYLALRVGFLPTELRSRESRSTSQTTRSAHRRPTLSACTQLHTSGARRWSPIYEASMAPARGVAQGHLHQTPDRLG